MTIRRAGLNLTAVLLLTYGSANGDTITLTHTQDFPSGWSDSTGGFTGVHWVFFPGDSALPHERLIDFGETTSFGVASMFGPSDANFDAVAEFMSGGSWVGNFGSGFTPNGHAGDYQQLVGGNVFSFPEVTHPLLLFQPLEFSLTLNGLTPMLDSGPCPCSPLYMVNYTFTVTGNAVGVNPNPPPPPVPVPEPGTLLLLGTGVVVGLRHCRYFSEYSEALICRFDGRLARRRRGVVPRNERQQAAVRRPSFKLWLVRHCAGRSHCPDAAYSAVYSNAAGPLFNVEAFQVDLVVTEAKETYPLSSL